MIEPTDKEIDEILDMLKGDGVEVRLPRSTVQEKEFKKISYIKWISFLIVFVLSSIIIFMLCKHYLADPCSKVACQVGRTCSLDTENKAQSVCRRGFEGENCEKFKDFKLSRELKIINATEDMRLQITGLVFINDDILASSNMIGSIKLWNFSTGHELKTLRNYTEYGSICLAFNGDKILASGCFGGTINLLDISTGKELRTLTRLTGWILKLVFISESVLASVTFRGMHLGNSVELWNVKTGQVLTTLEINCASNNDSLLAMGLENGDIKLYDIKKNVSLSTLSGNGSFATSMAFNSDDVLAAGLLEDGPIKLWNVTTGQKLKTFIGHTNRVHFIAFRSDDILVSASADESIKFWDLTTGRELRSLNETVSFLALNKNKMAYYSKRDNTIKLWSQ